MTGRIVLGLMHFFWLLQDCARLDAFPEEMHQACAFLGVVTA